MTTFTTDDRLHAEKDGSFTINCADYSLKKILEVIEEFRQEKNPPHKEYENTYKDGWLDACNEIYWAIERAHGIR